MKFKEKINWRLKALSDFIKNLPNIKFLYKTLDKESKINFLIMTLKFFFKMVKPNTLFNLSFNPFFKNKYYNPHKKQFFFQGYIFKFRNIKKDFNDKKTIKEISSMIKEIFIVLDCGAHIGAFSIYAAKKAQKVYAFEPAKIELNTLKENIKINHCKNIKIIPKAVTSKIGFVKLILNGTYCHRIVNSDSEQEEKIAKVKTISIDEFVKGEKLKQVNFIKMDIEGSETKALLGAKETLKKFKPKLAICIYHKVDDFYKIPLLIKKINPIYKIEIKNKGNTPIVYAI